MSDVEDLSCQRGHWKLQKGRHGREKINKLRVGIPGPVYGIAIGVSCPSNSPDTSQN